MVNQIPKSTTAVNQILETFFGDYNIDCTLNQIPQSIFHDNKNSSSFIHDFVLIDFFYSYFEGQWTCIAQMIALNIVELRKILQNTKQSIQKFQTNESLGCIWWLIFRGQVTSSCLRGIWPRMSFRKNINVKKS